jgi:pantoate--beta-alanine ligase
MIRTVTTLDEMKQIASSLKREGVSIGLVPTMGYFHDGHLSLMRRSAAENNTSIVSLFVNPTQFGPSEDLEQYPRDIERDTRLAAEQGVDYLFTPTNDIMYPAGYKTYVKVEEWSDALCGGSRPIHFRGVTTICLKLFNICLPDRAYFGLKDAQQYLTIKKMVADLNLNLEIIPMQTLREPDGLAMSSRNVYLNPEERGKAILLNRALMDAKSKFESGDTNAEKIIKSISDILRESNLIQIDYVEAVSTDTLEPVKRIGPGTLIAIAAFLGKTRLIDNLMI